MNTAQMSAMRKMAEEMVTVKEDVIGVLVEAKNSFAGAGTYWAISPDGQGSITLGHSETVFALIIAVNDVHKEINLHGWKISQA